MSGSSLANARLSTADGIRYALIEGYPKFGVEVNGPATAQEMYRILASDVRDFINEVVPPIEVIDGQIIIPPLRPMPGTDYLMPRKLTLEPFDPSRPGDPFGVDGNAADGTYGDEYRVVIDYETNINSGEDDDRDDAEPETFLERSIRSSMEVLSIPPAGVEATPVNSAEEGTPEFYASQKAAAEKMQASNTNIAMMVAINEYSFKWRRVIRPHFPNIFATMGCVNGAAYPWLLNAPAGTVLFAGLSGSQEFQNFGTRTIVQPWSIDLRFLHKQINQDGRVYSWNHAFNPAPGKGQFETIFRRGASGGASVLHPAANFNAMFLPGPNL
jgi:hypothetical protein